MSEANKALARRFYDDVMNRKNVDALDQLCAPSFVDRNPMPGQAPGVQGVKQVFATWMRAFPDFRVNVEALIAEGDLVVARFSGTATHTGELMGVAPTGKQVTFHGMDMLRVENGRVAEVWHYGDETEVLASLGVRPPQ